MEILAVTSYSWYDFSDATVGLLFGVAGLFFGYALRGLIGRFQSETIEQKSRQRLHDAETEAKNRLKEADIQSRTIIVKAREEFEKETKARKSELDEREKKIEERAQANSEKQEELIAKSAEIVRKEAETGKALAEAEARLVALAGMTRAEARLQLEQNAKEELDKELGKLVRTSQETARQLAAEKAREIVTLAIQKYALHHAANTMTAVVQLQSEEIKGRIIGREGRNIRALESATGVTMLIDEAPETVVLSSFDPVRREIARLSLEQLIADGRIHPPRIEEVVSEVTANMQETILAEGRNAANEAQVQNVPVPILRLLGRLKYRTSFSQNVLQHSIEVANLMGMMAGEIGGIDPAAARRAGLFHDIGKALDHEQQGKHALLGADFLRQQGENTAIVNAVASHHEDVPSETILGTLCTAADAISSSRPGARQEAAQVYVERLAKLEQLANSMPGVAKSYAVQAGREVRVIVNPGKTTDNDATLLARELARKIETGMQYPGQIKITVVRETRCIEYAR